MRTRQRRDSDVVKGAAVFGDRVAITMTSPPVLKNRGLSFGWITTMAGRFSVYRPYMAHSLRYT
ncbi:MAG TPA: hypothetical protein DEF92_04175 [Leclercia adecarboxylata]|nr:hypothetical protein [Leclercia adecarboxylata]